MCVGAACVWVYNLKSTEVYSARGARCEVRGARCEVRSAIYALHDRINDMMQLVLLCVSTRKQWYLQKSGQNRRRVLFCKSWKHVSIGLRGIPYIFTFYNYKNKIVAFLINPLPYRAKTSCRFHLKNVTLAETEWNLHFSNEICNICANQRWVAENELGRRDSRFPHLNRRVCTTGYSEYFRTARNPTYNKLQKWSQHDYFDWFGLNKCFWIIRLRHFCFW